MRTRSPALTHDQSTNNAHSPKRGQPWDSLSSGVCCLFISAGHRSNIVHAAASWASEQIGFPPPGSCRRVPHLRLKACACQLHAQAAKARAWHQYPGPLAFAGTPAVVDGWARANGSVTHSEEPSATREMHASPRCVPSPCFTPSPLNDGATGDLGTRLWAARPAHQLAKRARSSSRMRP
jgi:hypothetical protein